MEIPAGTLEKGESSIETAKRELREEIGMSADHLISTGSFYLAPGYSSEIMEVYIAKGLKVDPLPKDVDEDMPQSPMVDRIHAAAKVLNKAIVKKLTL